MKGLASINTPKALVSAMKRVEGAKQTNDSDRLSPKLYMIIAPVYADIPEDEIPCFISKKIPHNLVHAIYEFLETRPDGASTSEILKNVKKQKLVYILHHHAEKFGRRNISPKKVIECLPNVRTTGNLLYYVESTDSDDEKYQKIRPDEFQTSSSVQASTTKVQTMHSSIDDESSEDAEEQFIDSQLARQTW
eukprot:CAMPEP_0118672982 /NCGR_PEP_ID=MMETSP0800-20121206/67_1 /TAXON_ID=210618 ORGANISM="Striatella unipunctata, Strain CCMP2910" /NCGR_SAMPLE_ID=MMETSP0800 /ASSEMBLY_ACC=CAM_ASM_000638 /LENGTH=191 /DNA_ID=CAMNT_0006567991 /DNA_START=96 /DNA_END=668 /DNA_ORIENTATION=-